MLRWEVTLDLSSEVQLISSILREAGGLEREKGEVTAKLRAS